jgi:hypothetical protein
MFNLTKAATIRKVLEVFLIWVNKPLNTKGMGNKCGRKWEEDSIMKRIKVRKVW